MECDGCPESALLIENDRHAARRLQRAHVRDRRRVVAIVLVILLRRWRAATPPQRRALAPVLWSGVAMLFLLATALGSDAAGVAAAHRRARRRSG